MQISLPDPDGRLVQLAESLIARHAGHVRLKPLPHVQAVIDRIQRDAAEMRTSGSVSSRFPPMMWWNIRRTREQMKAEALSTAGWAIFTTKPN